MILVYMYVFRYCTIYVHVFGKTIMRMKTPCIIRIHVCTCKCGVKQVSWVQYVYVQLCYTSVAISNVIVGLQALFLSPPSQSAQYGRAGVSHDNGLIFLFCDWHCTYYNNLQILHVHCKFLRVYTHPQMCLIQVNKVLNVYILLQSTSKQLAHSYLSKISFTYWFMHEVY